jgi:uncharacterized membrane protein
MAKSHTVSTKRSLFKSVTFRAAVIVTDLVVIYLITHRVDTTVSVTVFTNVASTILYFLHERVWNRIQWGRSS